MSTTATYRVLGMSCGHCVKSVTEEVSQIPGVTGVDVELVKGGESVVTVTSSGPVPVEVVRAAVDEAGYDLVDPAAGRTALPVVTG